MSASQRILDQDQQQAVERVREALQDLWDALSRIPGEDEDAETLRTSLRQLDDFFLLVVVGEFNAGKSALINALLGEPVLAEGVTPTTTQIQILTHTEQPPPADSPFRFVTAGAEMLRDIHLVDTPGTNAIAREHEALTQRFVPRADLVLFVTSADRPFTESEHQFLERIRNWGKKVVLVVNKADILRSPEDLEKISTFVRDNVRALLGFTPELFAVSARSAQAAKQDGDEAALEASRFPALEQYVRQKLDDQERFRLKLSNPLGVGMRLIEKYSALLARRLETLREDVETVEQIRRQLDGYQREMNRGFQLRLAEVDNLLHQFEKRGHDFFEDTVRAGRIFDLMNKAKVKADFEQQVIGDLPKQIEGRVNGVIDWLVASDLQQWQAVRDHLVRRRSEHSERVAGQLAGGFEYDRVRLLDTVGKAAQTTLEEHDQRTEAARMADSVQAAVANAALLEVGAVGLGTAVTLIATSTAADVTGILAAGVMAAIGFFVIPHRRQKAKRELHQRIARLREQLMGALTSQFQREIERSVRRIDEAVAPYVQFVEGERASLTERRQEIETLDNRLAALRNQVTAASA